MGDNNPSYYAVITAEILHNNNLTDSEKILLAHISTLQKSSGECFASNAYFSKVCNASKQTISRRISSLVSKNIITSSVIIDKTTKQVIKRIIKTVPQQPIPIVEIDHRGIIENEHTPIVENDEGNNTSINNTSINNIDRRTKPKKRFVPPSINQCYEYINNYSEAEKFYHYYESNGWKVGKNKMVNWKSALTRWAKQSVINNRQGNYKTSYEQLEEANNYELEKIKRLESGTSNNVLEAMDAFTNALPAKRL